MSTLGRENQENSLHHRVPFFTHPLSSRACFSRCFRNTQTLEEGAIARQSFSRRNACLRKRPLPRQHQSDRQPKPDEDRPRQQHRDYDRKRQCRRGGNPEHRGGRSAKVSATVRNATCKLPYRRLSPGNFPAQPSVAQHAIENLGSRPFGSLQQILDQRTFKKLLKMRG